MKEPGTRPSPPPSLLPKAFRGKRREERRGGGAHLNLGRGGEFGLVVGEGGGGGGKAAWSKTEEGRRWYTFLSSLSPLLCYTVVAERRQEGFNDF